MNKSETIGLLTKILNQLLEDKGLSLQEIDHETALLGGDLAVDSLDLAAIVVEMESVTGTDPFAKRVF